MNQANLISIFVLLTANAANISLALANENLSIGADVVAVSVKPGAAGRNFVHLPSIEFEFNIVAKCNNGFSPGSLTLSIADTYKSLSEEQLAIDVPNKVVLRIPAKQIAPVAIDEFCISGDSGEWVEHRADQLVIRDALSVQASLLCASELKQKTVYVSRPLDIRLNCERPPEEQPDQATER